ncbi:tRNA pseudouridine(38-40) synthase TruA [Pontibacter sp. G13]|uniref:tRNA pseudouridine(38-40) synthase TruA n=1 Tax=Pontibacter sp. G13 TaxID=3074898 RepID=UPI00288A0142|nr:tRNA pseudouridine(38-40) synthase TruA [Pontibacter sp. G13]WNJ17056.1 tRNA pseudouridine(38-40) synthase TruA [Pontibacter sp. G13]
MRYFLDITFKGTKYAGWQIQPNAYAVQQAMNETLSMVIRDEINCVGAGRTDAGVHARQLIIHFDTNKELPDRFMHSMNGILPFDISVNGIYTPNVPHLHSRFHATSRAYFYQIVRRKSPIHYDFAMRIGHELDVAAMNEAAKVLFEFEEFGAFCKSNAGNQTNLCDMMRAEWVDEGDLLKFHIRANRFLRGMVRGIVGTLLMVGAGKLTVEGFRQIVASQDRTNAGPNADAKGLFLSEVNYPEGSLIPWSPS